MWRMPCIHCSRLDYIVVDRLQLRRVAVRRKAQMYYRQKNHRNKLIAAGIIASMLAGILLAIWLMVFSSTPEASGQVGEAGSQPGRTTTPDTRPGSNGTATPLPFSGAAGTITRPD